MKKSYIKIILFIFTFSFIILLNSLKFKMLGQIGLDITLLLSLVIVYFTFGFEKDRHRYSKDIILEIIIVLMAFFLLYYLSGVLIGFAKNTNYLTINSFCTCIFFIIIENAIPFSAHSISFNKDTFLLIALTFLPSISENILCSYLGLNLGYKPGIVYLLIMNLYKYFLPIIPNPNEYLYSLIFLLLPLIVLIRVINWFKKDRTEEVALENYKQSKKEFLYFIPLTIFISSLIYIVSGYFRYYAVAVASGSMEPKISKGDVVIVDKIYNEIKVGNVLAYNHDGKIIVHRIYRIVNNNSEYFIYTKGDANNDYDKYKITEDMIVGIVKFKIPIIGYPTILLNERW